MLTFRPWPLPLLLLLHSPSVITSARYPPPSLWSPPPSLRPLRLPTPSIARQKAVPGIEEVCMPTWRDQASKRPLRKGIKTSSPPRGERDEMGKGIKLGSLHRKERKCKRKGVLPWQFSLSLSVSLSAKLGECKKSFRCTMYSRTSFSCSPFQDSLFLCPCNLIDFSPPPTVQYNIRRELTVQPPSQVPRESRPM